MHTYIYVAPACKHACMLHHHHQQHLCTDFNHIGKCALSTCRLISIHNNPENLKVPKGFQQLKMSVADVHTQDITPYFNPSYDLIEEARNSKEGTPLHAVLKASLMSLPCRCMLNAGVVTTLCVYSNIFAFAHLDVCLGAYVICLHDIRQPHMQAVLHANLFSVD